MTIQDSLIILCGTGKDSILNNGIKSPFILPLSKNLEEQDHFFFPTVTTALDPRYIAKREHSTGILSYYKAINLKQQEEVSELQYVSPSFKDDRMQTFGNRTRIKALERLSEDQIIALSYERESQKISLRFIRDTEILHMRKYSEGQETNIPTDVIVTPTKHIIFSGIANGFHYRDGHNYKHPKAYSFLIKTDSTGIESKRFVYSETGHAFVNDILFDDGFIYALASVQTDSTGMDIHCLKLDNNLNLIWTKPIETSGTQESSTLLSLDQFIYIVGTSEKPNDLKSIIQLSRIDKSGVLIWTKEIGKMYHAIEAIDIVYLDNYLYIASNSKQNRTASPIINLQQVSLDGELKKELTIK